MMLTKTLMVLLCAGFFTAAQAQEGAAPKATDETPVAEKTVKKEASKGEKKETKKEGKKKMTTVVMETSMGPIEIELNSEKAPVSTENFLKYVDAKHYDSTIFHRVIKGFMIQGGGFDEKMSEKKGRAPIENEAANGLKNDRGTIAMARTSVPNSATAQFFINSVNNDMLNFQDPSPRGIGYAVFGKVTKGMDVVDKIEAVTTGNKNGMEDVPTTPVVIKSVKRK